MFRANDTTVIMEYILLMPEYVVLNRVAPMIIITGDLVAFPEPDSLLLPQSTCG